ncbi:hypothetical protein [Burkholderia cenocepacia]|uniref:hypothetical protein n=1 Tax=Burkholderia cenocepacia TaxID=95486 RepID=UPI00196B41A1|nr:hypothetical protein [Burkholderia cenocepacia]MBN3503032.1 hypothetical protein [Burkholderia cenocepacia]MCO1394463.1 hypothetical protein [Burkholderia cenocepacia]MCO1404721.1 hypothetical protein [Burkholderia cenocepacia]MCO8325489.1 hypothetical protein [Burkholderia cenocepacia]MCO8332559.1 hypothetical protein [Burkholderia cenocepacia]
MPADLAGIALRARMSPPRDYLECARIRMARNRAKQHRRMAGRTSRDALFIELRQIFRLIRIASRRSDCAGVKAGKFNRITASRGRHAATPRRRFTCCMAAISFPFISQCEINRRVISDITRRDLAIISRQVI